MSEYTFTDANFEEEVLKSELPVLVDFWAAWCVPCRMLAPAVEKVAEEYSGKIKVGKLNVDENPETAGKYGIQSIPTLTLFHKGEEYKKEIGLVPKNRIEGMFKDLV